MSLKNSHCVRSRKEFSDQCRIKKWQKRLASKLNRFHSKNDLRKVDYYDHKN